MVKSKTPSPAWEHFKAKTPELAQCQLCTSVIGTKAGSTSGLLKHLRLLHKINYSVSSPAPAPVPAAQTSEHAKKRDAIRVDGPTASKQVKLDFCKLPIYDINNTLARLTAEDGFTFNGIANSSYLKHAMARDGMKLPKNPSIIRDHVLNFHQTVVDEIKHELEVKVLNGERFSGTTDEWTSIGGRRFLNMNLHGRHNYVRNLGLVRITGTFTAKKAADTMNAYLADYSIDMEKHVFAITADGAAVMKLCGELSAAEYQGCYSHALHLAVCDVLYESGAGATDNEETNDDNGDDENGEDDDENESGDEEVEDDAEFHIIEDATDNALPPDFRADLQSAISHVRTDVKKFRRSPKSNEVLQANVKASFGKELKLILDVKTRWNSLYDMLERYCKLRSCIVKTMIDIRAVSAVSEHEYGMCKSLCDALEPVKEVTKSICRNDATLVSADASIVFLLNELQNLKTDYAKQLHDAVKERIGERRHPTLVALAKYLLNPETISKVDPLTGLKVKKESLITLANSLSQKLFSTHVPNANDTIQEEEEAEPERVLSVRERLQMSIESAVEEPADRDLPKTLKEDFKLFEATKKRSEYLENLFNAVMTAKPTSVESERSFSVGGGFATKIRSRLSDKSLSALVMLKMYFKSKRNQ